ncbi:MAG: type I-C CRISPR-associated protein Cas7/Csd2 [Chitinispirillaceae bacterium]|jgi:CRISPR-associated protein Csd2
MSLKKRYDFVFLFDVADGNPNGDPDAGNLPRVDAESGHGLVTDVCIKRKIRNYVILEKRNEPPYKIWVREKAILNEQIEEAYDSSEEVKTALAAWQAWQKDKKKNPKPGKHYEDVAKDWMCLNFYDIRTFGAVMSTSDKAENNAKSEENNSSKVKKTAGQVRGPVQITFARSIEPIVTLEHSISVCAARKGDKPIEEQIGIQGRKFTIPYGLYRAHGFISAALADQTGFSEGDLALLWEALAAMFEHDRSAARGMMATRGLYIFEHDSKMGSAHAHELFDRISIKRKDEAKAARSFDDYKILVNEAGLSGVKLFRRIAG